jgi:two-component system, cell cycle response regulator DivK
MEKAINERKHLILVVDDNEDMRCMLAQLLKRAGYQVVLAGDGQTSLTQAKQYHPDLILMDLSLPDISGWEAVELLRKMPAFHAIPIIAVTAHVSAADQERALSVGCDVHLGKPFKTRILLQRIADLLTEKENTHEET